MDLADRLQSLARRIPGVAGYQDLESSRDTDKLVRLRLADWLDEIARSLDGVKREAVERKLLDALPAVDAAASLLARVANEIRYASRGYRAFLDRQKIDREKLDRIYQFDLDLVDEVERIRELADKLTASDAVSLGEGAAALMRETSALAGLFTRRQNILSEE
jgi:hypothetical protein